MILEVVRILDSALRNATIGLAAQLATVPRESGDPVPTTPIISNEATDKDGALDRVPDGPGPFLQIASGDLSEPNLTVMPARDAGIDVMLRYTTRSSLTDRSLREASYTVRAIRQTLAQLPQLDGALRTRNSVTVYHLKDFRAMKVQAPADDVVLAIGMTVSVTARDLWALGLTP
jgi:hypothetical protein